MTERVTYAAYAVTDGYYGDPEVLVVKNVWDPDGQAWVEEDGVVDHADLPQDEDNPIDLDWVLSYMGWRVVTSGRPNDYGWQETDFGGVATVEPTG
jgi:hypothetical protein